MLQSMLAEDQWLRHVLMRLAGDDAGQDREDDEQAREALAETVLLLVGVHTFMAGWHDSKFFLESSRVH